MKYDPIILLEALIACLQSLRNLFCPTAKDERKSS